MAINYGLFFSRDGQVLRLPHNPEKLPVSKDNDNGEYNVLGIGPITIPRDPKQQEVTISGYFPGRADGYTVTPNGFLEPEVYIQFFQSAMDDKAVLTYTPVRYYEDGTPYFTADEGFQCLVMSFTYEERGGETGDFYYDLTIREWRDYSPQTVTTETQEDGTTVVTQEPSRDIPQGQLYVGATVVANGPYYYTSYGDEPHGNGNGRRAVVSRIVADDPTRPCQIHITTEDGGDLGWISADGVQVVSTA
jgi:hypothetical protein